MTFYSIIYSIRNQLNSVLLENLSNTCAEDIMKTIPACLKTSFFLLASGKQLHIA
jgi:hypothetical protein